MGEVQFIISTTMAAVACAGAVSGAVQWAPSTSSAASCAVGASRSVAFRGAAVAVKPLRICSRRRQDDGIEMLTNRMQGLSVRASAEGGEGELVLNKPEGSGKKVRVGVFKCVLKGAGLRVLFLCLCGNWVSLSRL